MCNRMGEVVDQGGLWRKYISTETEWQEDVSQVQIQGKKKKHYRQEQQVSRAEMKFGLFKSEATAILCCVPAETNGFK